MFFHWIPAFAGMTPDDKSDSIPSPERSERRVTAKAAPPAVAGFGSVANIHTDFSKIMKKYLQNFKLCYTYSMTSMYN